MRGVSGLYLALIVAVTFALLMRLTRAAAANELNSPKVLCRYGFFYKRFRMGALWWGAARLATSSP